MKNLSIVLTSSPIKLEVVNIRSFFRREKVLILGFLKALIWKRPIKKINGQTGFTVVEVVVATLIFAIAASGLFAMVTGLQKPAIGSSNDVSAALLGKQILENLRTSVDASTWNTSGGPFDTDPTKNPHNMDPITGENGITYTPSYTVEQQTTDEGRKIRLNITW